jgi:hypothetical protein
MKIIELKRCGDTCGHFDFQVVEGSNGNKVRWCWEARKQIPVPSQFINGFPYFCPLKGRGGEIRLKIPLVQKITKN